MNFPYSLIISKGLFLLILLSFLVSGAVAENVDEQSLENIKKLIDSEDYDKAIVDIDNKLESTNDNSSLSLCWQLKAIILSKQENFDEAIPLLNKSIEYNSNDPNIWNDKGANLYYLGRYEEAIVVYDEAIRLDPDNPKFWNDGGVVLISLDRDEDALISFNKALELDPEYIFALNNKGIVLSELGKTEEANEAFDRANQIKKEIENENFKKYLQIEVLPIVIIFVAVLILVGLAVIFIKIIKKRKQKKIEKKRAVEREKARIANKIDKFIDKSEIGKDIPSWEAEQSGIICEEHPKDNSNSRYNSEIRKEGAHAGICPVCGSPLVWRRAKKTGELYRGCTNYNGGCHYNERSY